MAAALKLVTEAERPPMPDLSDVDACEALAQFHRDVAERMPVSARRRALVLRCAGKWDRIGGAVRRGG